MEDISPDKPPSKREAKKLMRDLKIITAISMGKDRNKELAKVLDTDKSFAAKKVMELEEEGLVRREGKGKKVRYTLNPLKVAEFLRSKVVITWKENEEKEEDVEKEERESWKEENQEEDMK